jgi:predicted nucleic acid-binding protein
MTIVIDASVAVKWVLPEPGSAAAASLREQDVNLIAPSLIAAEIGNAIWKVVRKGIVAQLDALDGLQAGLSALQSLVPIEDLLARAITLAITFHHPIYDCFYLALAEHEGSLLVTADEDMIAVARKAKIKVKRL